MKRALALLIAGSVLLAFPMAIHADCESQGEQNCNTQHSIDYDTCFNTLQSSTTTECGAAGTACLAAIAAGGPVAGSAACTLALIICLIRAGQLNAQAEACYMQADLDRDICIQNVQANCDPLMY